MIPENGRCAEWNLERFISHDAGNQADKPPEVSLPLRLCRETIPHWVPRRQSQTTLVQIQYHRYWSTRDEEAGMLHKPPTRLLIRVRAIGAHKAIRLSV